MNKINPGYVMLDAGGLDLSSSASQSISGSWARVMESVASMKPIIAYNMIYGTGKELTPVPCFGWPIGSDEFVLVSATLRIHVKDDDTCTVLDVTNP